MLFDRIDANEQHIRLNKAWNFRERNNNAFRHRIQTDLMKSRMVGNKKTNARLFRFIYNNILSFKFEMLPLKFQWAKKLKMNMCCILRSLNFLFGVYFRHLISMDFATIGKIDEHFISFRWNSNRLQRRENNMKCFWYKMERRWPINCCLCW